MSQAVKQAKKNVSDVLMMNAASRLNVDDEMMDRDPFILSTIQPNETLFVVNAMTGQDAAISRRLLAQCWTLQELC